MSLFNKAAGTTASKIWKTLVALPTVLMTMVVSSRAFASGTDLLASGDSTVQATFGADSTIVKWLILFEVITAAVLYIATKKFSVIGGVVIISIFVNVGLLIAGY